MAKIPLYNNGSAPLAAPQGSPVTRRGRTVMVDLSGLASAAGGAPSINPAPFVRADVAGGASIASGFKGFAKIAGFVAEQELKARAVSQVDDSEMSMADESVKFEDYMAGEPDQTKWGEEWNRVADAKMAELLKRNDLAPMAREEIERRAKKWKASGGVKVANDARHRSLSLSRETFNVGYERAVLAGDMEGADQYADKLVSYGFQSPAMGQLMKEDARREDEANRSKLSYEDAQAFAMEEPSAAIEAAGDGVAFADGVQITSYGYEKPGDPTYDKYSAAGIGDHNNRLTENLSVALSPSILRELGLPKKSDGREVQVHLEDGRIVNAKWDDKTADKFQGRELRGVDFYNKNGPVPFDGQKVRIGVSMDGLSAMSRKRIEKMARSELATQNAIAIDTIGEKIMTGGVVDPVALDNELATTELREVDKRRLRDLLQAETTPPQDRREDWAAAYDMLEAFPFDPDKTDGKWGEQYSKIYNLVTTRLSESGGRKSFLAELNAKYLGTKPEDPGQFSKAYSDGKTMLNEFWQSYGWDDYVEIDIPWHWDTKAEIEADRKAWEHDKIGRRIKADQMLRDEIKRFIQENEREPDAIEDLEPIINKILMNPDVIDMNGEPVGAGLPPVDWFEDYP